MDASIIDRIGTQSDTFSACNQRIATYILADVTSAAAKTINELAEACGVSTATISRFAKTLGYASYSQLRWALASEINAQPSTVTAIDAGDSPKTVARKTLETNIETLTETFALIKEPDLMRARDLIVHAQKLAFYGLGSSNIVALDAYNKFMRMPLVTIHNEDYHLALMQTAQMTKRDCAIVISHTGNDVDCLALAKALQDNQVPIIIITSFADTPLSAYGDVTFYSISQDDRRRFEAIRSLTSQIAINDCLYALTAQYFGKRGERTRTRVQDVISTKHQA